MGLKEKLNSEAVSALKSRDSFRADALRFLIASIHNKEIEKRAKSGAENLTEEEILEVLNREAKKRKEAAEFFKNGGRQESAEKELKELEIIKSYLPAELGEEEIQKIVDKTLLKLGVKNEKDFGRAMGEVMKNLKGKADANFVSNLVRDYLKKINEG